MENLLKSRNRKGGMEVLVPAIITLVIASAILTFGLIINQSLSDTTYDPASATVANETTIAPVNETGVDFAKAYKNPICTVVTVTNRTTGLVITAGNYTATSCNIKSTVLATPNLNNSYWNITYTMTYEAKTTITDATNESVIGLGTFGDYWEIIVLAVVITIVLSLIMLVMGGRNKAQ